MGLNDSPSLRRWRNRKGGEKPMADPVKDAWERLSGGAGGPWGRSPTELLPSPRLAQTGPRGLGFTLGYDEEPGVDTGQTAPVAPTPTARQTTPVDLLKSALNRTALPEDPFASIPENVGDYSIANELQAPVGGRRDMRDVDTSRLSGQALADAFGYEGALSPRLSAEQIAASPEHRGLLANQYRGRSIEIPETAFEIERMASNNPDKLTKDVTWSGGPKNRQRSRDEDVFRENEMIRTAENQARTEQALAFDNYDSELAGLMRAKKIAELQRALVDNDASINWMVENGVPDTKEGRDLARAVTSSEEFSEEFNTINEALRRQLITQEDFDRRIKAMSIAAAIQAGTHKYSDASKDGAPSFNFGPPQP